MGRLSLAAAVMLSVVLPAIAQDADTILTNARIYTVDDSQPWVESVAIRDGRFLAVGSNELVDRWQGDGTKVVDLGGQFVMPGFVDAHIHPVRSQLISDIDMSISAAVPLSPEEFADRIKAYAEANPDKAWLIGAAFS